MWEATEKASRAYMPVDKTSPGVQKALQLGEGHDLVEKLRDLGVSRPQYSAIDVDVLPPGQLAAHADAHGRQQGRPPMQNDAPGRRLRDAADQLEKRAFAGPVAPTMPKHSP